MTQREYEMKMQDLNMRLDELTAPVRIHMQVIEQQKAVVDAQLDELRTKSRELGSRYYTLCVKIEGIKSDINALKRKLYLERPDRQNEES